MLLATFCLSAAAVQVTEDTTVSLTANSDTSYEIADGVTLTIDTTGVTNVLSGCITGTGTAKLRKTGLGTLALSNANNSVPGGIFVDEGILRADAQGCLGDGPITITFTTAAKGNVSFNAQNATFNNNFTITGAGASSIYALSTHKNVTLNGSITAGGILSVENYPVKGTSASKNFQTTTYNGDITMPTTKAFYVRTYGTNVFNGAITADCCTFGSAASNDGVVHLNNPRNNFKYYGTYRPNIHCGDTNVLRNAYVHVPKNNNRPAGYHSLNMHGHDQLVNYLNNASTQASSSAGTCPITSDTPCTLTLAGKVSGTRFSGHIINGAVSLVVDAENAGFVQCFSNVYAGVTTTHTTTGTVTVKKGALMIRGDKTSFSGLPQLTVEENGTLTIDTRGQAVFSVATNFTVDGKLTIGADASAPFMAGVTSLTLGENASFTVNTDVKSSFSEVYVRNGDAVTRLATGDYEYPDDRVPQLKAGGFTVVGAGAIAAATWTGGGGEDTAITNLDNWDADSLDFSNGMLVPTFAEGGNTATVSSNVKFQNMVLAAAAGETGFTFAKGSDEGRVTFTGTSLDVTDTDSTARKYVFNVPFAVEGTQTLAVSLPGSKTLAFAEGMVVPNGMLSFNGTGSLQLGGSSSVFGGITVPAGMNLGLSGTLSTPGDVDQGIATVNGPRTFMLSCTSTAADGKKGLVVSNAVIRKPLCINGGGSANAKFPFHVEAGTTNFVFGNVLLNPSAGCSNIRLFSNAELTFAGGVRSATGPFFIDGDAGSRAIFVEKPVTSRVEYAYSSSSSSVYYFGFAIRKGHAVFDVLGNSLLHLRIGRSNEANSMKAEFLRSDMFSCTNTTFSAGLYNNSSATMLPITANNASAVAEFHSTTQRFARVIAGPKSTFNGDEGALLEIYGAQVPDSSGNIHVTEANLYVAAKFTGGLSLKMGGTGTLLLTNAVSSTSGGIEVTNGIVKIASDAAWTNASYIAVGGTGRLEIEAETGLGRLATFPKTAALSLSGEGVLSIPDGDELRLGSLTVDGAAFSCGRYTYATAPAVLKAHLAETEGSIVIGRIGTLFLVQ